LAELDSLSCLVYKLCERLSLFSRQELEETRQSMQEYFWLTAV